jgi:hypothetical protein
MKDEVLMSSPYTCSAVRDELIPTWAKRGTASKKNNVIKKKIRDMDF